MCEEFGKLPTEILAEMGAVPVGWLEEIIEARYFGRAYFAYQRDHKATGPMVELVKDIEATLAQEAIDSE